MEKQKFIFIIEAERQYNVVVRITTAFNRLRIPISELHSQTKEDKLRVMITVEDTRENLQKLSRRLEREIDIYEVQLFESVTEQPVN